MSQATTLPGRHRTASDYCRRSGRSPPGFNRWLVPPAALCIHLCIGMAYGFSVFWKPLQGAGRRRRQTGPSCSAGAVTFGEKPIGTFAPSPPSTATGASSTSAGCTRSSSCCSACRPPSGAAGSSASGPRKAGVVSALCWCGGLLIAAFGVYIHQLWLMWLGAGVIGGIGLGPRLHLAGLDAHQVVPRPARHGDRHGHHGLRRRRHDRLAARHLPDERFSSDRRRRLGVWQTYVASPPSTSCSC